MKVLLLNAMRLCSCFSEVVVEEQRVTEHSRSSPHSSNSVKRMPLLVRTIYFARVPIIHIFLKCPFIYLIPFSPKALHLKLVHRLFSEHLQLSLEVIPAISEIRFSRLKEGLSNQGNCW